MSFEFRTYLIAIITLMTFVAVAAFLTREWIDGRSEALQACEEVASEDLRITKKDREALLEFCDEENLRTVES